MRRENEAGAHEAERLQAEADSIEDSAENLDGAPPNPLIVVPRPMACGAFFVGIAGAVIGAAIGFLLGFVIYGWDARLGMFVIPIVLAVAGLVTGGVLGGWRGGQGAKARDEQRPSHAGKAPGTKPVRREDPPEPDKPIGWQ